MWTTIMLLSVFFAIGVAADSIRNPGGKMTINQMSRYSRVELESARTRFGSGESIKIRFRIKNTGYQIFRFYPQLTWPGSFKFLVIDKYGREIKPKKNTFYSRDNQTKTVINTNGDRVKEIILHPNEVFEKSIPIDQLYHFAPGNLYRISGYFWPKPGDREYFIRSINTLRIRIDSPTNIHENQVAQRESGSAAPLVTPEETVFLFLAAEMRQNWNNHLKYLDLKRYITSYDRYASQYAQATVSRKPIIIEKFKSYLMTNPADKLMKFKITGSEPERMKNGAAKENGRYIVIVSALRAERGYSARYEYKYTLQQFLDQRIRHWKIINVEATIKNTGDNQ